MQVALTLHPPGSIRNRPLQDSEACFRPPLARFEDPEGCQLAPIVSAPPSYGPALEEADDSDGLGGCRVDQRHA